MYLFSLTEMAMLEEHPVFDPSVKTSSQQQNEKKKAPLPQTPVPQETTLNLSLLEKPEGAAKEEKGVVELVQYEPGTYHIFTVSVFFLRVVQHFNVELSAFHCGNGRWAILLTKLT